MRKFGRKKDNRNHLVRNIATSLVLYETVDTTEAKAKETKSYLDKIIARSKKMDQLTSVRYLNKFFFDNSAIKKLTNELFARYEKRDSGFIRSYHLQNRLGDNAPMMRLELVDKKVFVSEKDDTKTVVKKTADKKDKDVKVTVKESVSAGASQYGKKVKAKNNEK